MAQLGGAHVACEWTSNVLTKILQRPRLAAYLEQSTRYIAYDAPMPGGGYRYYRDAELGPEYEAAMDALFGAYSEALPRVRAWVDGRSRARDGESDAARRRAVKAKALDLLRGLLPAASLSHMGIYATGQAYEQLILHLIGHPLPEARRYGELILAGDQGRDAELRRARRAAGPRRRWVAYLQQRRAAARALDRAAGARPRATTPEDAPVGAAAARRRRRGPPARRAAVRVRRHPEERHARRRRRARRRRARARCSPTSSASARNRRHRPGRGFEALRYRFEIVSDYGAFRDLQRHRMLTVQWQALTPDLGAEVPDEVVEAGCGDALPRARSTARARSTTAWPPPATPRRRPTRSASATGCATCSTSTPARRCT